MNRKLDNWIDGFVEYTKELPASELFRKWCAISCIAGSLERKVWVHTMGSNLYPTMYIILVAPPGVGKTIITSIIANLWNSLSDHHVSSSSVTKASLIDELKEAEREVFRPNQTPPSVKFNSLKIVSNELGVLIPQYDNEFMNVLTDIYDGHGYSESRRSSGLKFNLKAPQLNILAATTPSYLSNILPEGAWDQGFLSRTLLVYSGVRVLVDPFATTGRSRELYIKLEADLKSIGSTYGEVVFSTEAKDAITSWHMSGGPPAPDHPKLHHYLTRRTIHMLKLCMVACIASGTTKEVTLEHFQTAIDWLIEMEHYIPDIFKAMTTGGDMKAIEDSWYFAYKLYAQGKKPIPESKIVRFLQTRVPAHAVDHIINIMVKGGMLQETTVNKIGKCFIPLEKG